MNRRDFLASVAATACPLALDARSAPGPEDPRTFATPADAAKSPPETLAYVVAVYEGTGIRKPDYLATIDVDPKSQSYSQVVHRLVDRHPRNEGRLQAENCRIGKELPRKSTVVVH